MPRNNRTILTELALAYISKDFEKSNQLINSHLLEEIPNFCKQGDNEALEVILGYLSDEQANEVLLNNEMLLLAFQNEQFATVDLLVSQGVNINSLQEYVRAELINYCKSGKVGTISYLFDKFSPDFITELMQIEDSEGSQPAVSVALENDKADIAQLFIDKGLEFQLIQEKLEENFITYCEKGCATSVQFILRNVDDHTAMKLANKKTDERPLFGHLIEKKKQYGVAQILAEYIEYPNALSDRNTFRPLHYLCQMFDSQEDQLNPMALFETLLAKGAIASINCQHAFNKATPLVQAIWNKKLGNYRVEIVEKLLESGAYLTINTKLNRREQKTSALHVACGFSTLAVLKVLLANGALIDITYRDDKGRLPYEYMDEYGNSKSMSISDYKTAVTEGLIFHKLTPDSVSNTDDEQYLEYCQQQRAFTLFRHIYHFSMNDRKINKNAKAAINKFKPIIEAHTAFECMHRSLMIKKDDDSAKSAKKEFFELLTQLKDSCSVTTINQFFTELEGDDARFKASRHRVNFMKTHDLYLFLFQFKQIKDNTILEQRYEEYISYLHFAKNDLSISQKERELVNFLLDGENPAEDLLNSESDKLESLYQI